MLLESWRDFEKQCGDNTTRGEINKKMPKRIKKKRLLHDEEGVYYYSLYVRVL